MQDRYEVIALQTGSCCNKPYPSETCLKSLGPRKYDSDFTTHHHYDDVIMGPIASQITSLTIVYSIVYSDTDQRKHQSSVSLAFVRGIHRGPGNSPHKWPVTRKMFPFDDVIMIRREIVLRWILNTKKKLVHVIVWCGQAITWANVDLDLCRHMTSLGDNVLSWKVPKLFSPII